MSLNLLNNLPNIRNNFEIIPDNINPQLVIYYDKNHIDNTPKTKYKCKQLLFCLEYTRPNMRVWNYTLQWDYTSDARCLRFPTYAMYDILYGKEHNIIKPANYDPERILRSKKKFCAFVYYAKQPYRNEFFDILSGYKHIDSPGKQCNNMAPLGGHKTPHDSRYGYVHITPWIMDNRAFFRDYKFVIAFEKRINSGYVSEKIYNPMCADSIPIYLGHETICKDFNTKSFVHVRDFFKNKNAAISTKGSYPKEFNEAAKYIMELDKNDKAYCDMLAQPWYNNNTVNEYADKNKIAEFFIKIFNSL